MSSSGHFHSLLGGNITCWHLRPSCRRVFILTLGILWANRIREQAVTDPEAIVCSRLKETTTSDEVFVGSPTLPLEPRGPRLNDKYLETTGEKAIHGALLT